MKAPDKTVVGRMTWVDFYDGPIKGVPAKVDSGADLSSVWASQIEVDRDSQLHFCLFDTASPFFTGRVITTRDFKVTLVRSSNGHEQLRYSVKLKVKVGGRLVRATFTLTDRSRNNFPILIGSKLLRNKFIVDVAQEYDNYRKIVEGLKDPSVRGSQKFTRLSKENPRKFFETHYRDQFKKDLS